MSCAIYWNWRSPNNNLYNLNFCQFLNINHILNYPRCSQHDGCYDTYGSHGQPPSHRHSGARSSSAHHRPAHSGDSGSGCDRSNSKLGLFTNLIHRIPSGGGRQGLAISGPTSAAAIKSHHGPSWPNGRDAARLNASTPPPPPPPTTSAPIGSGCVCEDESEDDPDGLVMRDDIITLRSATTNTTTNQRMLDDDYDNFILDDDAQQGQLSNRSTSALSHYPGGTPGSINRAMVDVECYTRAPTRATYIVNHTGQPVNGGIEHSTNKGSIRNLTSMQQQQGQLILDNDVRPQYN